MQHAIILAENQVAFRAGVSHTLKAMPDVQVVDQCGTLSGLREAVLRQPNAVVLVSEQFACAEDSEAGLAELLTFLQKAAVRTILICDTTSGCSADDRAAAAAVIPRSIGPAELVACVRRVLAGEREAQQPVSTPVPGSSESGLRVLEGLTQKELQIIALVAEGAQNKMIALRLRTTVQVIKNYLQSIYDKTGVSDRLELAVYSRHHRAVAEAAARAYALAGQKPEG